MYLFRNIALQQLATQSAFVLLQTLHHTEWMHPEIEHVARQPGVYHHRLHGCVLLASDRALAGPVRAALQRAPSIRTPSSEWTWQVAEGLAMTAVEHAYPEVGVGPDDGSDDDRPSTELHDRRRSDEAAAAAPTPAWRRCLGCRWNMARGRREHTRERGVCKFPDVQPEPEWQCPGCRREPPRPRGHADQTEIPG